jgi:hypothetical protein
MGVFDYSLTASVFALINLARKPKYLWFTFRIITTVIVAISVTLCLFGSSDELLDNSTIKPRRDLILIFHRTN